MKGVIVRKAKLGHTDERRDIIEIMNGELGIRTLKILRVKKDNCLLGKHWHPYSEVMYMIKGKARYKMHNLDTGETEEFELEEGDTVFRTGRIVHGGYFSEDSVILDGAVETYVNADFNDIFMDIW